MAGEAAVPALCQKILVFAAADGEALSRFRPTLDVLATCAHELVFVTRASSRLVEIEALGARTIDFNDDRLSGNAADKAVSVWRLARIIEAEQPDVVHLVGSRSIVMGGLALRLQPAPRVMLHVTGRGPLGIATRAALAHRAQGGLAAGRIDAARSGLLPAGREPERPCPFAHRWCRPGSAFCHPGRARHRPAGVPGAIASGQRRTGCGLRRRHDQGQRHRRAVPGLRPGGGARHAAGAAPVRRARRHRPRCDRRSRTSTPQPRAAAANGTDRLPTRTPSGAAPTSACCPPGTAAACRARCWRRPPARARCW